MSHPVHHPALCEATTQVGQNDHRCYDDPGHPGAHVCVCWYRWPATVQLLDLARELGFNRPEDTNPVARLRGSCGTDLVPLKATEVTPEQAEAIRADARQWAARAQTAFDAQRTGANVGSRFD